MNETVNESDALHVRAVSAEGARIGLTACDECGACILLDPSDIENRVEQHEAWHDNLRAAPVPPGVAPGDKT